LEEKRIDFLMLKGARMSSEKSKNKKSDPYANHEDHSVQPSHSPTPNGHVETHHHDMGTEKVSMKMSETQPMDHSAMSYNMDHSAHQMMQMEEPGGSMPEDHAMSHAEHVDHTGHEQLFRRRFWISLLLSIPVLLFSQTLQKLLKYSMPIFPGSRWIEPIFAVVVFIIGGLPFLRMAVPELQERKPGMMMLISLAISVSLIYSVAALFLPSGDTFFWELVTLIDIMLLGHWIEMRSVRQASGALNELAKLLPDQAERLLPDGTTETVPVGQLKVGDVVLARPGTSIAADGEVIEGDSDVNESMITGESRPVSKKIGGKVIAGTINGDGSLRVKVTAIGDATALAGIMRLVRDAQQSKSRTQLLADKAAGWLFYIALGVAALTGIIWTIAIGFNVEVIARVATVLVIACPHALGLAVPLVVAITTSIGAKNGILVRDRHALEEARLLNTIVFDKTGTLTKGEFGVVEQGIAKDGDKEKMLSLAAAIEGDSEHTIARGLRKTAEEHNLPKLKVADFEALKGRGVKAKWENHTVYVGGPQLLEMLKLKLPGWVIDFEHQASDKGQSVVYLIVDNDLVSSFALADVIRSESKQAVDALHKMGLKVAMLTGDSQSVAETVAKELGIDTVFAGVLPENKENKIAELQKEGKRVAMVGDGVNDAPALTRANIGIAIGSGTDVAIESAGIILVRSNPLDIVKIIELSRASYRKMMQNLAWATGYNVVALPLAAGVLAPIGILLSPALGAVFMSVSTIIVAINAQQLRLHKLVG
jgi:Cu2+-exporting ATPase